MGILHERWYVVRAKGHDITVNKAVSVLVQIFCRSCRHFQNSIALVAQLRVSGAEHLELSFSVHLFSERSNAFDTGLPQRPQRPLERGLEHAVGDDERTN